MKNARKQERPATGEEIRAVLGSIDGDIVTSVMKTDASVN